MRSALILIFAIFLNTPFSLASLGNDLPPATSFFRDKTSLFPSGQASRKLLEEKLLRNETEILYLSTWDKKEYWLDGQQLLRDIQVARYVEARVGTKLLSLNRNDAAKIKSIAAKTQLEIMVVDGFWARVKERDTGTQGWITLPFLQARYDDVGVFVNIMDTYLRKEPNPSAKILTTLPRLTRVLPLEITKNFLKIQYQMQVGYVDITDFASHADFANLAYHPQKNWLRVLYRNNDTLITKEGIAVPLNEILGYAANSHRGIVVRADSSYGPPLRSRVEIVHPEANIWGISFLEGHGEVWWKKKNLLFESTENIKSQNALQTDELIKREIYSIAFENNYSIRGIVSSDGVYRTDDGLTWTLLPQFGKKNYPVSIHPNGTWFIGSYKSINQGKTFEPFIRWDHIAQAIESAYHRNPKILRLTQIEALPNSQIQIYVDTGHNNVKLRSFLNDSRWNVIKK
ncbi:MAG: SH3 domain-containing protein [Pseudobdellovibrionaceae bacterium]